MTCGAGSIGRALRFATRVILCAAGHRCDTGFTTRRNAAARASGEQKQNCQCRELASAGPRAVSSRTRQPRGCKALFFPRYVFRRKAAFAEHCWLPAHPVRGPRFWARRSRRRGLWCPRHLENRLVGGGPEDALLKQPLTAPALAGSSLRRCRRIFIQYVL